MSLSPVPAEKVRHVLPTNPDRLFIYQINTWVWLNTMSRRYGEIITLHDIPDLELDAIARPGIDLIWLMGVWQRSPAARKNALKYSHEYRGALPDLTEDDVIGSAYAMYDYEVDERIGGRDGLAALRKRLRRRGLSLMLDFVPNHLAFDHPWLETHPEYFIAGTPEDVTRRPSDFFIYTTRKGEARVYAHGRDPLWPGWSDTAQLNIFSPPLRKVIQRTLVEIAKQCDAVRCDMAMLMITEIFANTWRGWVGDAPAREYWVEMIGTVKKHYPDFLFVAEAYWGKEFQLITQGFDYAYDKVLYDRIIEGDVQKLRQHLALSDVSYQRHMIRFIENHDEKRAFDTLGPRRSVPAATLICTLPGAVLLHDGQFTGRRVKLPVQIKRQPDEVERRDLEGLYNRLLKEIRSPIYQRGEWMLFDVHPLSPGDITHWNLLAYGWLDPGGEYRLIVVNMTHHRSHGRVNLSRWTWLAGRPWRLYDVIDGAEYQRHGETMTSEGLTIILEPYEAHVFRFEQARDPRPAANGKALNDKSLKSP